MLLGGWEAAADGSQLIELKFRGDRLAILPLELATNDCQRTAAFQSIRKRHSPDKRFAR